MERKIETKFTVYSTILFILGTGFSLWATVSFYLNFIPIFIEGIPVEGKIVTITKVDRGKSGTRTTFQTNFELNGSPYSIELKAPGSWPKVGRTVSFLYFWDERDSENPHKGLIASTDSGIIKIIMDNGGWAYLVLPFITSFLLIYGIYFLLSKFIWKIEIPHTQKRMGKTPTKKNLVMSLRDWFRKPLDEEYKKKFVEDVARTAKVFFLIIVLFVLFIFVLEINKRFHIF